LWMVDNACLACIGLAAGSEVAMSELRRNFKATAATVASVAACCWTATFFAFDAVLANRVEFLSGLTERHVVAVGSLLGTLSLARSPASALAVINECEASGPYCSHILSTTVLKDVIVVALFAINVELVAMSGLDFHRMVLESALGEARGGNETMTVTSAAAGVARKLLVALKPATQWESPHPIMKLLVPFARVVGAVFAGVVAGVLLGRVLKPTSMLARWKNIRVGVIACVAAAIFIASEHVGLEPLLVCVIAGLTASNRKHSTGEREREDLRAAVSVAMPAVNLLFFTLAGASLRLENAFNSITIAVALVIVRLFALYCATAISARVLKAPTTSEITGERRKNIEWMGHVTQAGVALGLARTVAARFPHWGDEFSTLAVSIIVINLLIGPVLFRASIVAMNEFRATLEHALDRVNSATASNPPLAGSSTTD
jgi:Kef-type K+ transport system membrane component KefB